MIGHVKYVHTNLIAKDWQKIAQFYIDVFGCSRVGPPKMLSGPDVEAGTGVAKAVLSGVMLLLPGYTNDGPLLEIFSYPEFVTYSSPEPNRLGFAHLAFDVDDVESAREEIIKAGGRDLGRIVTSDSPGGGSVTWCYFRDPEGNVIELIARHPAIREQISGDA